ncbi:zinc finger protein 862-like [Mercenaria mercenaria]|uniref:zinc finger protein 862-like n=1 Tax=Mercenaria mercenaria TaxID=6596 RepID=UPI00234ED6B3|nr:zinc finger protein 862-like [Mercenaria mercenaria]
MVTFVQFYDKAEKDIKTVFLSIDNLLEESDSANAQTITQMIVKTLTDFELEIGKLSSFVSDGASVMTGKQNGVAARLKKEVNPKLISIHCICHRLALACTDTLEDATYFKQVQLWLVQLWKLFENSPKKLAVYFKVQTEMKSLLFTVDKSKNVAMHRLKKACQTRWLSFNSSVQAILKEYPTVLQTLNKLQSSDSAALGLLIKIRSFKFVSAVYILAEVLPHLDQLSKTFQLGTIGLCQVLPSIQYTNDKLDEIADSLSPIEKLCKDLETDGCLSMLELQPSDHDITGMKCLCRKYIDALKKNIEARFGNTLPILSSLAVIDANKVPGKNDPAFKSYGVKDIQVIAEYFDLDKDELTAEWGKLKYDLLRWNSEDEVKPQNECLKRLVSLNYFYPILSDLADILLSLPVSNAWPERGASAVKRIKTRLRSSLKNDMLQVLMNVSINGPEVSSNECDEVCKASVKLWLSKKKRKKLPTGKISKSTATASVVKCFSEAEVQTDSVAENVISREEISDIIRAELLAYDKSCRLEMNESDSQSDYDSDD